MSIHIANILPIIIILQSLIFTFVLYTDNGPKKFSNRLLGSFLLLLAAQFIIILSEDFGNQSGHLYNIMCAFGFSYGPLLHLYTHSLTYTDYAFQSKQLLHFAISFTILVIGILGYPICVTIGFLLYVSLLIYVFLAILQIFKYRNIVMNTRSTIMHTELKWLQWTMILFTFTMLLDIIDQFVITLHIFWGFSTTHITIFFLLNWMFYKGLKQPQIFLGISKNEQSLAYRTVEKTKTNDIETLKELDLLKSYMELHKPYVKSGISLQELAIQVEIPMKRLSYLINTHLHQNFMGFINSYRIELAKQRLTFPKDPKETILEVMYEVGFHSKSSFNTLFKEKTGKTPSEFKREQHST